MAKSALVLNTIIHSPPKKRLGTLERDNYPMVNKYTNGLEFRREDASPLAAIDRSTANKMLGGEADL